MRRSAVPAALVVLALVSGCGGSDNPSTTPTTPAATDSSPTESEASPSADVATGIRLTRPNSTVVAPEGWSHSRKLSSDAESADSRDHLSYITLAEIEAFGSTVGAEELGRTRISSSIDVRPPKLLPVTELDGVPVYHVAGFVNDEQYIEEYGAIRNDRIVSLLFSFNKRVPVAEREDVVAQVLPTFEWK